MMGFRKQQPNASGHPNAFVPIPGDNEVAALGEAFVVKDEGKTHLVAKIFVGGKNKRVREKYVDWSVDDA